MWLIKRSIVVSYDKKWLTTIRHITYGRYVLRIINCDKLESGNSDIVTYDTRCPEWTYMAKEVGLKLFRMLCYGLV